MTTAPGDLPSEFREALARRASRLAGFASPVIWYDAVSSTNDVAARAAAGGAAHGTVVAADSQGAGRGRMGRTWFSPPGCGLYVSVVLRPSSTDLEGGFRSPAAENTPGISPAGATPAASITLTAGVAIAEGVREATGLQPAIKWPNDLVVGRRKVCGILAEAAAGASGLLYVVLGYGINVLPASYPADIAARVTSIEAELGRPADRADVLAETLAALARRLRELSSAGLPAILDRWRALSPSSTGHAVQVMSGLGWTDATTAGVDVDGALLVTSGGATKRVVAGEVRWLGT